MTRSQLLEFLRKHRLGVLSTVSLSGEPEAAVVGIAVTDRLELVFDTLASTRKVLNLRRLPKIAFVVGWDTEITTAPRANLGPASHTFAQSRRRDH